MLTVCSPSRVEFGAGASNNIGDYVKFRGGKKILIIMDAFLASPQIVLHERVEGILDAAGVRSAVYSGITGEPDSENVAAGVEAALTFGADCILALGGGSAIDTAKAVAVKTVNPDLDLPDIPKKILLQRLPLIAIPTTSGTGSEATRVAVITNLKNGVKENPGHSAMIPDIAVLDPELMLTLPPAVTAFTGMDALTHAMEAYISNKATVLSDLYAYEAMKIVSRSLPKVLNNGLDIEERAQMALASYYAGVAFSNASTNLAHAGGRALGAYFHVPHGLSVAVLLPFVMEFGLETAAERYANVALALGASPQTPKNQLSRQAIEIVNDFNDRFGIWTEIIAKYLKNPQQYRAAIPDMVKMALSGNGILTNPKVPDEKDVTTVFEKLAVRIERAIDSPGQ